MRGPRNESGRLLDELDGYAAPMRTTATCPKCSGKKIVVADIRHITGESHNAIGPRVVSFTVQSFLGVGKSFGRFETWICAACGFTETYAVGLGDVDLLASQRPEEVRIVESGGSSSGPFR
jgi:predicted nucleic-acid-binding Zn-ribbon protein